MKEGQDQHIYCIYWTVVVKSPGEWLKRVMILKKYTNYWSNPILVEIHLSAVKKTFGTSPPPVSYTHGSLFVRSRFFRRSCHALWRILVSLLWGGKFVMSILITRRLGNRSNKSTLEPAVSGPSLFLEIEVWSRRQELKSRSEARDIFDRTVQKADKPLTKAQVIALSRRRSDHEQEIERVRDRKRKLG